ncbi:rhodanese-like domain-containing protein [Chloroflexota bacterium]
MIGLKSLTVLTGSVLMLIGACGGGTSVASDISDSSVQEAYEILQSNVTNAGFVVLDIRTPKEYAAGYIEDAINIDYYASTFRDDVDELDKNKTYLVYCRTANRSGAAMPIFEELGFETVYNMIGGIVAWQAAEYPIVGLTQPSM